MSRIIYHILESIDLIEGYSKNTTQAQFFKKSFMQDAIIRRLEIIGEAVKNLPDSFRAKYFDSIFLQVERDFQSKHFC